MRLRVGDYRVRFHDHGDSILVLAVKHRREVLPLIYLAEMMFLIQGFHASLDKALVRSARSSILFALRPSS